MTPVQTSGRSDAHLGEEQVRALYESLGVTEHPILKLPTLDQVRGAARSGQQAELIEMLRRRQDRIKKSIADPLLCGFEAETWKDADALLKGTWCPPAASPGQGNGQGGAVECEVLGIFGGNRAQKTYYAIKRAMQCAEMFPGTRLALCSEKDTSSITNLQTPLVWPFLQPRYGHLNGKRHTVVKINYTQGNGFTDGKVVLPNGSEIYFLTYNQNPDDYEGWEFGAPVVTYEKVCRDIIRKWEEENQCGWDDSAAGPQKQDTAAVRPKPFIPPNIGAVADESMPLKWLQMFSRRVPFRQAKTLWTFTPVRGITPAVKELVGASAVTLESRPSELLPRKNLPDVPEGQMPYVRKCSFKKAYAIYFFSEFNKWGPTPRRSYYHEIKDLCAGKESQYVERVAYGFARDTVARAFSKFGPWNIIKRNQLPAKGTNYHFIDPAGARKWFMWWVRVGPPKWGDGKWTHYIYRDWPDAQTYGEWAVPTEREVSEERHKGWDGDPGPAQGGLGMGITKYKETILEAERIKMPLRSNGSIIANQLQAWEAAADPYHVRLVKQALARGLPLDQIQEEIPEAGGRYIDPRAGKAEHQAPEDTTCIIDEFADVQVDSANKVTGPAMELTPASGVNEDEGLMAVNELLYWNDEEKLIWILNQPHLFVCEDCLQVRWMFENYTGRGGEKGACKDPADLARYMALAKLDYLGDNPVKMIAGGGLK